MKTTPRPNCPWFAIFCVIVYSKPMWRNLIKTKREGRLSYGHDRAVQQLVVRTIFLDFSRLIVLRYTRTHSKFSRFYPCLEHINSTPVLESRLWSKHSSYKELLAVFMSTSFLFRAPIIPKYFPKDSKYVN